MGVKEEDASMQENINRPLVRGTVITYRLRRNNKPGKGRVKQAGYYVILVTNDDGSEQIVFYDELLSVEPIDMLLVVADSADEPAYVPPLEAAGYVLQIREPDWYQHRMFKGPDTDSNLHVYTSGCPEIDRVLLFRNWLRSNTSDRLLYERTKRDLASRDWKYMQNYADAKTAVVEEILARAQGAA